MCVYVCVCVLVCACVCEWASPLTMILYALSKTQDSCVGMDGLVCGYGLVGATSAQLLACYHSVACTMPMSHMLPMQQTLVGHW